MDSGWRLEFIRRSDLEFEDCKKNLTPRKKEEIKDKVWDDILENMDPQMEHRVLTLLKPWKYQILKKVYPSIRRKQLLKEVEELPGCNKFILSYWFWESLPKPVDNDIYEIEIKQKVVDQTADRVEIVCTAAEENYYAICTATKVYFYRIENINSPVYSADVFGDSDDARIISAHFYQNKSGRLICIVQLNTRSIRFFDVKYRYEVDYANSNFVEADVLCVGTYHNLFVYTEEKKSLKELELETPNDFNQTGKIVTPIKRCRLFNNKYLNINVFYMFSENDKLFVGCDEGGRGYVLKTFRTPIMEHPELIYEVDITNLQSGPSEGINQLSMPVNEIIMSVNVSEGRLLYGTWQENFDAVIICYTLQREAESSAQSNIAITTYTMHADILFLGFENGMIQIIRVMNPNILDKLDVNEKLKKSTPILDDSESKTIQLGEKFEPITSICVSEFKKTLFIVATTSQRFYTVKFTF